MTSRDNNYTNTNIDGLLNNFNNIRITSNTVIMKSQLDSLKNEISTRLNNFLNSVYITQQTNNKNIYDKFSELKNDFIINQTGEGDNKNKTNIKTDRIYKAFLEIDNNLIQNIQKLQNINKDNIKNYGYNTTDINQRLKNNDYKDMIHKNVLEKVDKNTQGYLLNLDSTNVVKLYDNDMVTDIDITPEKINTRLNNCYVLENLYLKKHDELFTVFSFTVNLFDKYKHAIDILLFMIKYLVKYNNTDSGSSDIPPGSTTNDPSSDNNISKPTIRLPKTIIKDIHALVKDQETVQNIISSMKKGINDNPVVTENVKINSELLSNPTSLTS